MLNERASVSGNIIRYHQRQSKIQTQVLKLQMELDQSNKLLSELAQSLVEHQTTLEGLDRTIALAYIGVNPEVGGVVMGWAGRYGPRGALRQFIVRTLEAIAPEALGTVTIARRAAAHFNIPIQVGCDRIRYSGNIKCALRRLMKDGLVEPLHAATLKGSLGRWRVTSDKPPTFAEMALADEKACVHDREAGPVADPDPSGHQVAPKRKGCAHG